MLVCYVMLAFNKSLSTWQFAVANASLNFHSCHDCELIIVPCLVPLNLFLEASEFDFILLHSLIKQLVKRFCVHAVFFQGLLGLRFRDTNCQRPTMHAVQFRLQIPSNNPSHFTGMI